MAMIFLKLEEVPLHLRDSDFFRSLSDEEDHDSLSDQSDMNDDDSDHHNEDILELPHYVMKIDTEVNNMNQFMHLLETLRFWQSWICPTEIFDFCFSGNVAVEEVLATLDVFTLQLPQFKNLMKILQSENRALTAAELGEIEILHWLNIHNEDGTKHQWTSAVCAEAAKHGHIDCLRYLHDEVKCQWDEETCLAAFENGQELCLVFAIRNQCPLPLVVPVVEIRAELPFIGVLAYRGFIESIVAMESATGLLPSAQELMKFAVMGGQVGALKYLAERFNSEWDESICEEAAKYNHLACLEYAHTNGCPWTESTCASAARFGNITCLQFAIEHGCPCTVLTMDVAFWRGDINIIRFLQNNVFM